MQACDEDGLHALVYVMKYDARFDDADRKSIEEVRNMLGRSIGAADFSNYFFIAVVQKDKLLKKKNAKMQLSEEQIKQQILWLPGISSIIKPGHIMLVNNKWYLKYFKARMKYKDFNIFRKHQHMQVIEKNYEAEREAFMRCIMDNLKRLDEKPYSTENFMAARQQIESMKREHLNLMAPGFYEQHEATTDEWINTKRMIQAALQKKPPSLTEEEDSDSVVQDVSQQKAPSITEEAVDDFTNIDDCDNCPPVVAQPTPTHQDPLPNNAYNMAEVTHVLQAADEIQQQFHVNSSREAAKFWKQQDQATLRASTSDVPHQRRSPSLKPKVSPRSESLKQGSKVRAAELAKGNKLLALAS